MEKRDVIIIGSGIAGMTSAIYLKRFNINVLLIEKGIPGGQLNKIKNLKNYPGFLETDGSLLAEKIFKQVQEHNIEFLNEEVVEAIFDDKKIIKTKNHEFEANQIIIATGRAPKVLKIKGEEKLLGHGISYCAVCDAFFFKNKDVCVIGESISALENVMYLSNLVNKCYLICRKPHLDINTKELESLKNVEIIYNANICEFVGEKILEKIVLNIEFKTQELKVDGAFISLGYEPNFKINSKIDLDNDSAYLKVNQNGETNVSSVFAVGDAIKKELYQLTTAVSEAAMTANYIKKTWYK